MSGSRLFLGLSALVWFLYGLYCFLAPGSLAGGAGVAAITPTGTTELRAMYGGLQMALGILAGLGATRADMTRPALIALGMVTAGLGSTRLLGACVDGGWSAYTLMGLVIEFGSATWARQLLRRQAS
ncbi:MAG: DUF4345 domain-containing protein [bacterium]